MSHSRVDMETSDQFPKSPKEVVSTQLADDRFVKVMQKQRKVKQPQKAYHIDGVR